MYIKDTRYLSNPEYCDAVRAGAFADMEEVIASTLCDEEADLQAQYCTPGAYNAPLDFDNEGERQWAEK